MERFFILDKFNTWYDWKLVLTEKDVTPPEPKTNYVDIDGMSGSLDLSESLTGEVTYQDRKIEASFWTDQGSYKDRERLLQKIVATLHGRKVKIIEPDNPDHYFIGRVEIKSRANILPYAEFTIEAVCEPWCYALEETVRRVETNGITDVDVVICNNGVKTLCPDIKIEGSVTLTFGNATITLTDGTYKVSDIKLRQGSSVIGVSGDGVVTFAYREVTL